MTRTERASKGLIVALLGILVAALYIIQPAQAGGWLQKVTNAKPAQSNYRYQNQQSESAQASVTHYDLRLSTARTQAGKPVQAVADFGVLAGSQDPVQSVAIHYVLIDLHGQARGQATKKVTVAYQGGNAENMLNFTPPQGIPRGRYRVDASVLINGSPRATRSAHYDII